LIWIAAVWSVGAGDVSELPSGGSLVER